MVATPGEQRTEGYQKGTAKVRELVGDALPANTVVVNHTFDETGLLQEPKVVSQDLRLDAMNPPSELKMSTGTVEQLHDDRHDPFPSNNRQNVVDRRSPL
jgi:hypothetical protein